MVLRDYNCRQENIIFNFDTTYSNHQSSNSRPKQVFDEFKDQFSLLKIINGEDLYFEYNNNKSVSMFGKELGRSNNCYISQVAMIESKCEKADSSFRKKVNMPATVFTRSPLKDRQNKSIVGNTPSRKNQNNMSRVAQNQTDQSRRTSVSPLKNRRQANMPMTTEPDPSGSYSSARILAPQLSASINSHVSKSKKMEACQNHSNKQATYAISIDDEDMLYCDKCAISLASQGFKVVKFDDTANSSMVGAGQYPSANGVSLLEDHAHPRKQEISAFLAELEGIMQMLGNKKAQLEGVVSKSEAAFQKQIADLGNYYARIIEDINSHRKAVETALLEQKNKAMVATNATVATVDQAISDSNMMKQDIMSSLDLIKQAQQKDYRPIMESYKQNARKFKATNNKALAQPIILSALCLNDPTEIIQSFLNHLSACLTGQQFKKATSKEHSNHSSINFSFQGRAKQQQYRQQQQQNLSKMGSKILPTPPISEDQNPVDMISEEDLSKQRFMKSSLKDANGLFSQFDDFSV